MNCLRSKKTEIFTHSVIFSVKTNFSYTSNHQSVSQ